MFSSALRSKFRIAYTYLKHTVPSLFLSLMVIDIVSFGGTAVYGYYESKFLDRISAIFPKVLLKESKVLCRRLRRYWLKNQMHTFFNSLRILQIQRSIMKQLDPKFGKVQMVKVMLLFLKLALEGVLMASETAVVVTCQQGRANQHEDLNDDEQGENIYLQIHTVGVGAAIGYGCLLLAVGSKGKRFKMSYAKAV
ncbi:unnamed protein product [Lactuca virosa]|uniref:Uncharacterized protein n=1 Tax=Lactuca virosa TaxID=75947 RepID=A0AAU9M8D4_9ASTR|nr:unnamed protein product [Lactuca virosa]